MRTREVEENCGINTLRLQVRRRADSRIKLCHCARQSTFLLKFPLENGIKIAKLITHKQNIK